MLRGQLSQNFLKPGEANGLSLPVRFMLTNLLTTAATRPDFIAYDYHDRSCPSLRLMKRLYGVHEVGWTIRSPETLESLEQQGVLPISRGLRHRRARTPTVVSKVFAERAVKYIRSCDMEHLPQKLLLAF